MSVTEQVYSNSPLPTENPPSALIELSGASKTYYGAAGAFTALHGIDLSIAPGDFVAVIGGSGSGKSTLLNLVAGIDRPTGGEVRVQGRSLGQMSEEELALWRGNNVGIVFQFFQLLPTLTILENVLLPMDFVRTIPSGRRGERALSLLERVGIEGHRDKFPAMLSGGEQQRAALARALANDPPILAADEPTGNLDSKTTREIFDLFAGLAREGKTLLTVTHEPEIARWATRVVALVDGRVADSEGVGR